MKVLLVDDHPLILSALQQFIEGFDNTIRVVGVDSAAAARAELKTHDDFDLVLLDLALADADGFEVLVEFRSTYPAVPVVVVSASERTSDVIRALDSGAMGFVPKRSSNESLREALGTVMTGGLYIPPSLLGIDRDALLDPAVRKASLLGEHAQPAPAQQVTSLEKIGLTPRQSEVLSLLLKGLPNKLIARELNLSVETVKDHVAAVLRALGVSARTQAVLAVSQMNLTQPRPPA